MLGLPIVQSTAGESSTAQAGSGSPAARTRWSVTRARLPPAESPASTMFSGSTPWASRPRYAAWQSSGAAGNGNSGHQPIVGDERPRAKLAAQAGGERRVRIGKPERERPAVQVQHDARDARLGHDDPFARHAAAFDGHPLDVRPDPELPGVQLLVPAAQRDDVRLVGERLPHRQAQQRVERLTAPARSQLDLAPVARTSVHAQGHAGRRFAGRPSPPHQSHAEASSGANGRRAPSASVSVFRNATRSSTSSRERSTRRRSRSSSTGRRLLVQHARSGARRRTATPRPRCADTARSRRRCAGSACAISRGRARSGSRAARGRRTRSRRVVVVAAQQVETAGPQRAQAGVTTRRRPPSRRRTAVRPWRGTAPSVKFGPLWQAKQLPRPTKSLRPRCAASGYGGDAGSPRAIASRKSSNAVRPVTSVS